MPDQYDRLQPPNIISAIRSMPRRWASALYVPPPKSIDDFFTVPAGDGVSAAEHAGAMLAQLQILDDAIRTTSYNAPEELGGEVDAAMTNAGSGAWPATAADAIAATEAQMERLAERLGALRAADWNKSASTPARSLTVSDMAQGAVRVAAERLRAAERAIEVAS